MLSKHKIFKNDLKYKKYRKIIYDDLTEEGKQLYDDYRDCDTDSFEYRIQESLKENTNKLYLDLNYMDLLVIPKLEYNIKCLSLIGNNLKTLDNIDKLVNLKYFDCSHNDITTLNNLPLSLKELSCSNNKLKNLDILVNNKYDKLKYINCSYNQLNIIDNLKCKNLENLECSNNSITYIQKFDSLIELDCKNNNIKKLNNYPKLELLFCENNLITEIENYNNLQDLCCSNNQISKINNLNNIKFINCINNKNIYLPLFKTLIELNSDIEIHISEEYKILNINVHNKYASIIFKKYY